MTGLTDKYRVFEDGDLVEDCFVLEPDSDPIARIALIHYALSTPNDELAADILDWVGTIQEESDLVLGGLPGPHSGETKMPLQLPDFEILDANDEENPTVGLVEYGGSIEPWVRVDVQPELLIEFAEECREMGWSAVSLYLITDMLLLAQELGADWDMYVGMAPWIEEGDEE